MTAAVLCRIRSDLRRRLRAFTGLALLIALGSAVVLAGASGARRTSTAYSRYLEASDTAALRVGSFDDSNAAFWDEVGRVDGVTRVTKVVGLNLVPDVDTHTTSAGALGPFEDSGFGDRHDRPNPVEGRLPDPARADEVFVNRQFADVFGAHVGDRLQLDALPTSFEGFLDDAPPPLATYQVTVVGIGVDSANALPTSGLDTQPIVLPSRVLTERVLGDAPESVNFVVACVDVGPTASATLVADEIKALDPESVFVLDRTHTETEVAQAIRPQATALWVFTGIAVVAALLVIAQAVARQTAASGEDFRTLGALGMTRASITSVAVTEATLAAAIGLVVGLPLAILLSGQFPIGPARLVEPAPGLAVNGALLAMTAVGTLAVVTITAVIAARVSSRRVLAGRPPRISATANAAARVGAPVSAVLGARRAFERGGSSRPVPVRSAIAGAALAVAAVVATSTFARGLDQLVSVPANYGQTWNAMVDGGFSPVRINAITDKYASDIDGASGIVYGELKVNGATVPAIGFDQIVGHLGMAVLEGDQPHDDEIVLGTRTMGDLGVHVGDTVTVESNTGSRALRVSGRGVFPQLGQGSFFTLNLGYGAAVTGQNLASSLSESDLPPDVDRGDFTVNGRLYNAVAMHATSDDGARRLVDALRNDPLIDAAITISNQQRPAAIQNYASIRSTPALLTAVLAVLGGAMIVHALAMALRRRRTELAMCKALGMTRRTTSAVVLWQCNALAIAALLIGLPIGIAGGRVAWRLFADDLGVSSSVSVPVLWIVATAVATCALMSAAGAFPARAAGRTPTAVALRAE